MTSTDEVPASFLVDPASLHILLVDANGASRSNITSLLQKYHYQVTSVKTSQEALQTLEARRGPGGTSGFDLILKEHSPAQGTNACRLLRKAQTEGALKGIPIIVVSTTEDRDVMVSCLQLGAADYMIKPLRHNEVRNLWARVYWWRRASYLQQQPSGSVQPGDFAPTLPNVSNGSQETKGEDEGQERVDEDSGEGSAPNGSGSMRHGSNEGGSKNDSKIANGWSGTQPKQAVDAPHGQGNGTSTTNMACQGSNHPGSEAVAAPANGGSPLRAVAPPTTTLHIAPLDLTTRPSSSKLPTQSTLGSLDLCRDSGDAAPGFRAYISSSNPRKRSADLLDAEMMARSSGSDHTQSLGDPKSSKRRTSASHMDSGSAGVVTSDVTFNLPADCNPGGAPPTGGSGVGLTRMGENANPSQPAMNQQAGNGFGGYYPFGMMTPFTVPPQFWNQMGGQGANPEMAAMFTQFSQQAQAQGGMNGMTQGQQQQQQQQQQVAMHNQLMMQHSMLMQQCGMPAPPFVSFQNLNRALATNQANQAANQTANQAPQASRQGSMGNPLPSRRGSAPTPEGGSLPPNGFPQGREAHGDMARVGSQQTWGSGMPRQHSLPASGLFTGTGNGVSNAGNTLGSAPGNTTGATSHASAQLGLDGSLTEPSRQERRAQALHKYKQKRKNLNFTKKIRYESRKQLAQARPRVKGQFVRLQPGEEESSDPAAMEVDEEISGTEEPQTIAGTNKEGETHLPSSATETAPSTQLKGTEECTTSSPPQLKQEAAIQSPAPASPTPPELSVRGGNSLSEVPKMSTLMAASQPVVAGQ